MASRYGYETSDKELTPAQEDYIEQRQRRLPVVRREELPGGRVLDCVCERCGAYHLGHGVEPIGSERVMMEKYDGGTIPQEIEKPDGSHHTVVFRCSCEVGRIYWPELAAYDAQPGTTRDDTEADVTHAILKRRWRALILHKHPDWTYAQVTVYMERKEAWIRARGKTADGIAAAVLVATEEGAVKERADLGGPF